MWTVTARDTQIPALGFGTFTLVPNDCRRMVRAALDMGYRHIDTAQIYENEAAVGDAIVGAGVPRNDLWLTTKVWVTAFRDGDLQRSVDESLRRLRVDHVDLLLLHWPNPEVDLAESLGAIAAVKRAGKARHIGISNFTVALTEQAVALSPEPLVTNQVEYHPYLNQDPVLAAARGHGMAITAYSPIAQGAIMGDPVLKDIGAAHGGRSEVQVALRWLIQQDGVCAIPRTRSEDHARRNLDIFDFELSADEMAAIKALQRPDGRQISPDGLAPEWDS